jgi:hypothetical protein
MSPSLQKKFQELEQKIGVTIQRVSELSEDQKRTRVGSSFSPLEMLEHMAVVEELYVEHINKQRNRIKNTNATRPLFTFRLLLKLMQRPVSMTTPTPGIMMPKGKMSEHEAGSRWLAARKEILDYLSGFDDHIGAFKEPFIGWLTPEDFFECIRIHQQYHDDRLPK